MRRILQVVTSPRLSARASAAFSLIELLLICGVVSLLVALTLPSVVSLTPSRKTGIHELAGFLEHARAKAIATRSEILVAFADESFSNPNEALRAYALFAQSDEMLDADSEMTSPLEQLSPWRSLPAGLLFARGEHFEAEDGIDFRTLLDLPAERAFPSPRSDGLHGSNHLALPCLIFGPRGEIRAPSFHHADALHLGVIEGRYDSRSNTIIYTSTRPRIKQGGVLPNGECLEIGLYTGRCRLLTD